MIAALIAFWLTGMIPLAAVDACQLNPNRPTFGERIVIYGAWPIWMALLFRDAEVRIWMRPMMGLD